MGKLEEEARKVRRRGQVQDAVLGALMVGGIIALGVVAGNAIQLLKYAPKDKNRFSYYAKTAASGLVRKGLATWVKKDGKIFLRITEAGRRKLALEQEKLKLKNSKQRWDKRWRMIVFDIPERRRKVRFHLRSVMVDVGFVRLQDSVWVYPYDCEEFVALLKAELKIGKDVLYAIVERIENDKAIRTHFNLPVNLPVD